MASKFLNESDPNQIKEEIKMTELGNIIFNDGVTQEAISNAKNFS